MLNATVLLSYETPLSVVNMQATLVTLSKGPMQRKRRSIVDVQKTDIVPGSDQAYWNSVVGSDADSFADECVRANPDSLMADDTVYELSEARAIMGEAIEHLQGRQKQVYLLHMRDSKSLFEVGEILSITKGSAQTYLTRAIAFVTGYCREAIARGRV